MGAAPIIGEAYLTLPGAQGGQKPRDALWGTDHNDPCPTVLRASRSVTSYWSRYISATRNARSSDWLRLSRGSQAVS